MPILIIIVLAIFAPSVLYAIFQTVVFGAAASLPLAAAGRRRRERKHYPMSTKFLDYPPEQLFVLAVVLVALAVAGSYAAYVIHSAS